MNRQGWILPLALLTASLPLGCGHVESRLRAEAVMPAPNPAVNFETLYSQNCAACHGENGRGGASIALASPVYLAMATDAVLRKTISDGVRGTPMPAFAQSAGGMLTARQVSLLVDGIRNWAKPGVLGGLEPPPYAPDRRGDAKRGAQVFETYCSSCHGFEGRGGKKAGSVVDPSYLALVSDQDLRTVVIMGRPALGAPDWRSDVPGHPLSDQEVTDVVAWLRAQRVAYPGQPYPSRSEAPTREGRRP